MSKLIVLEYEHLKSHIKSDISYDSSLINCIQEKQNALDKNDLKTAGFAAIGAAESFRRIGNFEKSLEQLKDSIDYFFEINDCSGMASAFLSKANIARQQCRYSEAIDLLTSAYSMACNSNYVRCAAYSMAGIAETTRICGNYKLSLRQHLYALKLFSLLNDMRGVVWAYEGVAQMYKNIGELHTSLKLFQEAETIASYIQDKRGLAYALKCKGEILGELFLVDDALNCLSNSIIKFKELNYKVGLGYAYKALADIYRKTKKYDLALENYENSFRYFSQMKDYRGIGYVKIGLGKLYAENKLVEDARHYLFSSKSIFENAHIRLGMTQANNIIFNYSLR